MEVSYSTKKGPIDLTIPIIKEGNQYKMQFITKEPLKAELQMEVFPANRKIK
jgi:hypothetical protein